MSWIEIIAAALGVVLGGIITPWLTFVGVWAWNRTKKTNPEPGEELVDRGCLVCLLTVPFGCFAFGALFVTIASTLVDAWNRWQGP